MVSQHAGWCLLVTAISNWGFCPCSSPRRYSNWASQPSAVVSHKASTWWLRVVLLRQMLVLKAPQSQFGAFSVCPARWISWDLHCEVQRNRKLAASVLAAQRATAKHAPITASQGNCCCRMRSPCWQPARFASKLPGPFDISFICKLW